MSNEKLNKAGVKAVWTRFFDAMKKITGDVDVTNKGTLQAQIDANKTKVDQCFQNVSNGKTVVANAITGKGVTTSEDAEFATMAENISKIKTSALLQAKSDTLSTAKTSVTMKPDTGYDGLSQASANIVLQEKTVAKLSTSAQTVTPDSGKVLSKVTVPAVTGSAVAANVLSGKTFNSAAGINVAGTMANKAGTTVKATAVTQDDDNTYLAIPAAGYYDTESKVYTENSNLGNEIKSVEQRTFVANSFTTISLDGKSHLIIMSGTYSGYDRTPTDVIISSGTIVGKKVNGNNGSYYIALKTTTETSVDVKVVNANNRNFISYITIM